MQETIWILVALVPLYMGVVVVFARPWLAYWHGRGVPEQYEFFRCQGCRRLITFHHIQSGGCVCRETNKISPAVLRPADKLRLLYLPWTVTSWTRRQESLRLASAASVRMAQRQAREAAK